YPTQSGIMAGAATFTVKGQQYVAVLTGRGGALPLSIGYAIGAAKNVPNLPRLLVFKLGGTAQLPTRVALPAGPFDPPPPTARPEQIAAGLQLFGRYCQVCHGASAGGGGVLPDLQRSGALANADAWKSILIDGALAKDGMVSFAKVMSPEQAQSIRLYVIDEANWAKKNLPQGTPAKPMAK
ncbi:MAG TPA: c-type cytochrome, partial [Sphingomonas sp.]